MNETGKKARDGSSLPRVRAVTRAISILRAFSNEHPYLSLGEIVKLTKLDAGTTRRLLITLRDDGLVWQDPSNGKYCASMGLLELGHAVPKDLSLSMLVEERIKQLAEETQTTVYLSTVSGDVSVCNLRHNGGRAIEVRWWAVGEQRPFNVGTGPRVLLAYQPPQRIEQLVSKVMKLKGEPAKALHADLEEIRSSGVIIKHDEIATGISAMAVPLFSQDDRILAAVSTGGLTSRYVDEEGKVMLQQMRVAAEDMRELLRGYSD